MSHGVSQVQCLTDALLCRILSDDALLHGYAVGHHPAQLPQIRLFQIKVHQLCPHLLVGDQSVLQHLCIARTDVLCIEGLQELRIKNHGRGIVENANLILQSSEVDTRLPAYTGIYHRE